MPKSVMSGRIGGAVKVLIYGPEGIGKSTFAAKFPSPFFEDVEGSTRFMDVTRSAPSSWTMLLEDIKDFIRNSNGWKTLVIDTADWAESLCMKHICATHKLSGIEDMGYGKGYVYLEEEYGRMLNLLQELIEKGMNVVVTAHATMRKFEQPDELGAYDRWELKLEKKTSALVKEWADMVLFANYKTYVVNVDNQGAVKGKNKAQGGHRVMFTTHTPSWDAKNRFGLKEELPFDYTEIAHCITENGSSRPAVQTQAPPPSPAPAAAPAVKPEPAHIPEKPEPASVPAETDAAETEYTVIEQMALHPGIPKALRDLMQQNNVTEAEIRWVVAHAGNNGQGYYPEATPIEKYDPQFIAAKLVGTWTKVFELIQHNRSIKQ